MGFRALRVINEDRVSPASGFGTHPHRDMEIITYVVSGALAHRDSMGNGSVLRAGDAQRMTAGTGVAHSEKNPSAEEPLHLLQIWILPERKGLTPGYEERHIPTVDKRGALRLVAAPNGGEGVLTIHQDVTLHATVLAPGDKLAHRLDAGRHAWVQVVRGEVVVNGHRLGAGDGAALNQETEIALEGLSECELLLFDLA